MIHPILNTLCIARAFRRTLIADKTVTETIAISCLKIAIRMLPAALPLPGRCFIHIMHVIEVDILRHAPAHLAVLARIACHRLAEINALPLPAFLIFSDAFDIFTGFIACAGLVTTKFALINTSAHARRRIA